MNIAENLKTLKAHIPDSTVLVVVTKNRTDEEIKEVYHCGCRIFGENKVQEIIRKHGLYPADVEWHLIGHLQRNKVKQILPLVKLIHGVDSEKLLAEIEKEAIKLKLRPKVLLQLFIASEESKFGLDEQEAETVLQHYAEGSYPNTEIVGMMGMASNVANQQQIENEFSGLWKFFEKAKVKYPFLTTLSMGMSGDYLTAIQHGSTMVRIGSAVFKSQSE